MKVIHRDELPLGGFAGLREHRLVVSPAAFGPRINPGTSVGLGNFVYLADARFMPKGETTMHGHKEVDVISVMVEGRIAHEGSLKHGEELSDQAVQVQRAGGEGFQHNEINPDDKENRMIQLWVLPEKAGEPAGYQVFHPEKGSNTRIYGGEEEQNKTYSSKTLIDVARLDALNSFQVSGRYLAYVTQGKGTIDDVEIYDGDLIEGENLKFVASENVQLIVVSLLS